MGSTSLKTIKGFGSAKDGVGHWRMHRLSALALLPLSIWLVVSLALLSDAEYEVVIQWLADPFVTILMLLTIIAMFYHLKLGAQVVIEDYFRSPQLKSFFLLANVFLNIVCVLISIVSVLRIAL